MNSTKKHLLHVENVYKQYSDKVILDNIDLSVTESEFVTVVGPSGCGKSTLLRLILGQEKPSSGRLSIDGTEVGYPNTDRGIVYQRYSLFPHLTVLENVMLGSNLKLGWLERRQRKAELTAEAMEYLARVKLEKHAHKYPHELSGGMQQRVAISQALILRPRILLMDEPFGALDPQTREEMQIFLLELWEEHNMTIFFVTHDLEEAVFLGTRIFALSQYYSDDRDQHGKLIHGAKIVVDHKLPHVAKASSVKHSKEFGELVENILNDGFNPDYLQHVKEFNLKHPDSWQSLTNIEDNQTKIFT